MSDRCSNTMTGTVAMPSYTFQKSGRSVAYCSCGDNYAVEQFAGFCEVCWLKLSPVNRAILRGEEPPVKEIVTQRVEILPARSRLSRVAAFIWRFGMTAAVAYLAWRTRR